MKKKDNVILEEEFGKGALSKVDIREYSASFSPCGASAEPVEFPEEFELKMPAVKNQGVIGSCVAHSLSTVIEYFNELQEGSYVKMSTGYIYGNRRKSNGFTGKGMYVSDALNTVVKYGDVPNKLFNSNIEVPEAIEVFEKKALDIAEEAYPNRFTEFFALNTVDDMKLNLMQNGPIVFSIQWYKGYYVEAGTNLLKFNTQIKDGSHCMVIYGWNKEGWLFQNSWGNTWGDGGRAVYPYDAPLQTCYGVIDKICNRAKDDKINELQKKFDEISAELAIKEDEINKLNFSLNNYRDLIENQNNEIAEKQKKIAELQCSIAAAESLKATNEHIIKDAQSLIKELNQDARETDANIKNCQNKIERIKSSLEDGIVLNKEELEQQIVDLENTIKGYQDKLTSINNQITDKNKTINAMQQEVATLDKNIEKLNNELSIYQNTYEEALKKLTEISEQNLLLTQEYNEALTKLNSLNETIKEQEKTINILNNQLIEIKKPYANWPRWIVKLINFIINLFGGKKK